MRISKYKNFLAKSIAPNWFEDVFMIKNVEDTVLWAYVIEDLNREEIFGTFYEN